jgi:protein gp37
VGENTKIEWTDHSWNPWEGCQKVGPGCDHCYAEARNIRFTGGANWGPGAPRRRTSAANWAKPLKWNREAQASGIRPRVFCASLADVFDNAVDPKWRMDLWKLIAVTPDLDWLLLTKRPGNIAGMLPSVDGQPWSGWGNVWLGCTVVNQAEADRDIPKLLAVPAKVRFLSIEPMLGPIDLTALPHPTYSEIDALSGYLGKGMYGAYGPKINWVICGGESGPHARPMHPDWARSLRDQCRAAGVPFLFKQIGEWAWPDDHLTDLPAWRRLGGDHTDPAKVFSFADGQQMGRIGKHAAGRLLDGREWNEVPS